MGILNKIKKIDHYEKDIETIDNCKLILENISDCLWIYDLANKCFKYISPSIIQLRGLTVEEAMKERFEDFFTKESLERVNRLNETRLPKYLDGYRDGEILENLDEFQQFFVDGTIKNVEISMKYLFNEETKFVDILGVSRDITKRKKISSILHNENNEKDILIKELKETEKKLSLQIKELIDRNEFLEFIADTDELTALNNRYFFDKKVEEEITKADNEGTPLSLIILDLDHFKNVNDTFGHDVGDTVLIKTADITRKLIGHLGTVARWGGEEFIILLPHILKDKAIEIAEKLRRAIESNVYQDVGHVTASFGVCEKRIGQSYESWFKNVDKALYFAKNQGRNRVVGFNDKKMKLSLVRLEWDCCLECGNKLIDNQHRYLFDLANGLMELSTSSEECGKLKNKLDTLLEYLIKHCEYEEEVLKDVDFPDKDKHFRLHKKAIAKMVKMKGKFLLGEFEVTTIFLFFIEEVVMKHIINEDVKFFSQLKMIHKN
ncbi:MAG: diguanylate cyclase [Clostridiaceae bacterium]